jgi:hypothetical protein
MGLEVCRIYIRELQRVNLSTGRASPRRLELCRRWYRFHRVQFASLLVVASVMRLGASGIRPYAFFP